MFGAGNGLGRLISVNGNIYEGSFRDMLYHGYGTLKDENGVYKGMFKNGKQKGFGILNTINNQKIVGEWNG